MSRDLCFQLNVILQINHLHVNSIRESKCLLKFGSYLSNINAQEWVWDKCSNIFQYIKLIKTLTELLPLSPDEHSTVLGEMDPCHWWPVCSKHRACPWTHSLHLSSGAGVGLFPGACCSVHSVLPSHRSEAFFEMLFVLSSFPLSYQMRPNEVVNMLQKAETWLFIYINMPKVMLQITHWEYFCTDIQWRMSSMFNSKEKSLFSALSSGLGQIQTLITVFCFTTQTILAIWTLLCYFIF